MYVYYMFTIGVAKVVCKPTFLDRILAFGSLIAMSQSLIFRVRLKEAQTMNKEHHASAPLYPLSATNILVAYTADINSAKQRQGRNYPRWPCRCYGG